MKRDRLVKLYAIYGNAKFKDNMDKLFYVNVRKGELFDYQYLNKEGYIKADAIVGRSRREDGEHNLYQVKITIDGVNFIEDQLENVIDEHLKLDAMLIPLDESRDAFYSVS